jgi:hypothetical protein
MFTLPHVLIYLAVAASVTMLLQGRDRVFSILALVASGVELLFILKVVTLSIRGLDLWLVLGGALAVCSAVVWARNTHKMAVTAATVGVVVGGIQVLQVLVH